MNVDPFIDPHPNLTPAVLQGLGWLYLVLCAMNLWWTIRVYREDKHLMVPVLNIELPRATFWALYTSALMIVGFMHVSWTNEDYIDRFPLVLEPGGPFQTAIDFVVANPVTYFVISISGTIAVLVFRKFLVQPTVGWILLNAAVLFQALSMTDYDFRQIVGKPDNVPIVALLYLVGGFTWLYFYKAVENDRRLAEWDGEGPVPVLENDENEKVWPSGTVRARCPCSRTTRTRRCWSGPTWSTAS